MSESSRKSEIDFSKNPAVLHTQRILSYHVPYKFVRRARRKFTDPLVPRKGGSDTYNRAPKFNPGAPKGVPSLSDHNSGNTQIVKKSYI